MAPDSDVVLGRRLEPRPKTKTPDRIDDHSLIGDEGKIFFKLKNIDIVS